MLARVSEFTRTARASNSSLLLCVRKNKGPSYTLTMIVVIRTYIYRNYIIEIIDCLILVLLVESK